MISRVALVMATGMAMMPATGVAKKKAPPPPAVTIVCERQVKSDTGYIQVTRTLDANGRLLGTVGSWVYGRSVGVGMTMFQAGWYGRDGAEFDLNDGWLGVEFDTVSEEAKRALRGKRYSVELATSNRPAQGGLHFRGRTARFQEFATSYTDITLDWGDVAAMARGADRLFVAARDKDGKLLRSSEVDRSIFAKAMTDVSALAAQVRADAADPSKNCRREVETNDIVL